MCSWKDILLERRVDLAMGNLGRATQKPPLLRFRGRLAIPLFTHRVVTSKGFEGVHEWQGRGVSDPLDRLRVCHHPDVVHRDYGVEEGDEAFFMMRLGEPGGVVEEPEGRSVK